jgi:hypothetical protein
LLGQLLRRAPPAIAEAKIQQQEQERQETELEQAVMAASHFHPPRQSSPSL